MDEFDFSAPAEVFASRVRGASKRPMTYRRFPTAAQAIRFAMEVLPTDMLSGTVLEIGEDRFEAADIRSLYESPEYPLERRTLR